MKFLSVILIAISVLLLPGCLELKTMVNVNADGSGTVEESIVMSSHLVEMISQFTSSFADSTTNTEKFSLFNPEELKSRASDFGPNVKYVSGKEIKTEKGEGYSVVYSFSDITTLVINQDPGSKISMGPASPVETPKELLLFKLVKGSQPELIIDLPASKDKDDDEEEEKDHNSDSSTVHDTTGMAEVLPLLEGFRINVAVKVNGSIVKTNASYVEGNTITLMDLNFGDLIKNQDKITELKEINPTSMSQVKDILKSIPGLKIEITDPVSIVFKK